MTIKYKAILRDRLRRLNGGSVKSCIVSKLNLKLYPILLKLIIGITFLFLSFVGTPTDAAEKNVANAVKKTPVKKSKCWKRTKAFDDDGNALVCKAFEQVLNTTCESPDQFKCNWTLPPGEKRFKKFVWQPIDWKSNWGLIKDLRLTGLREDLRENVWEKDQERIRKLFANRQRSLAIAAIDIDNDGYAEQVVRDDNIPCKEDPGVTFGVIDPKSNRLDWRFRYLFLDVNGNEGAEIMLYKSKAYMFGWVYGMGIVMIWEGSPGTDSRGRANICQFKYYKNRNMVSGLNIDNRRSIDKQTKDNRS